MPLNVVGQNRCTGHCCRAIDIKISPTELSALHRKELELFNADPTNPVRIDSLREVTQIYDMLVYKGYVPESPTVSAEVDLQRNVHIYQCRNYDWQSGNCTIHDKRPAMCSEFPQYSHAEHVACQHLDCTWDKHRFQTEYSPEEVRAYHQSERLKRYLKSAVVTDSPTT